MEFEAPKIIAQARKNREQQAEKSPDSPEQKEDLKRQIDDIQKTVKESGLQKFVEDQIKEISKPDFKLTDDKKKQLIEKANKEDYEDLEEIVKNGNENQKEKARKGLNKLILEQYLFDHIDTWLDNKAKEAQDAHDKAEKEINKKENSLPIDAAEKAEFFKDEASRKEIADAVSELTYGTKKFEGEKQEIVEKMYIFQGAFTEAGFATPEDLLKAYENIHAQNEHGEKTNLKKITKFRKLLKMKAEELWGKDKPPEDIEVQRKVDAFVTAVDHKYAEDAKSQISLLQNVNDYTLIRDVGRSEGYHFYEALQKGDDEALQKIFEKHKDRLDQHEQKARALNKNIQMLSPKEQIKNVRELLGFQETDGAWQKFQKEVLNNNDWRWEPKKDDKGKLIFSVTIPGLQEEVTLRPRRDDKELKFTIDQQALYEKYQKDNFFKETTYQEHPVTEMKAIHQEAETQEMLFLLSGKLSPTVNVILNTRLGEIFKKPEFCNAFLAEVKKYSELRKQPWQKSLKELFDYIVNSAGDSGTIFSRELKINIDKDSKEDFMVTPWIKEDGNLNAENMKNDLRTLAVLMQRKDKINQLETSGKTAPALAPASAKVYYNGGGGDSSSVFLIAVALGFRSMNPGKYREKTSASIAAFASVD